MTATAPGFGAGRPERASPAWAAPLKDAMLAALVATLLALPLVGLQTYDIGGGALGIRTHFDWVAIAAAAVFAGRLAMRLRPRLRRGAFSGAETAAARLADWANRRMLPLTAPRRSR